MGDVKYNKLRVLIADDFSNFRATMTAMLNKMGVVHLETSSNGLGVIQLCEKQSFDLVLCDYDLGEGKTGQQVLEELHHRSLLPRKTIFIIVSADSAKDVVMASYDCEPDDYLMKPITGKMLEKRISRLLSRREALTPVYKTLDAHAYGKAMSLLIDISISDGRNAIYAQKLLGELFIDQGELGKAEKLYTKALQTRQVDWARLGLARVKHLNGELETAGAWLEKIVEENPLYLPAYDTLASNWEKQGQVHLVQEAVQRSVDISPKSILRQKKLADVAERNGDLPTAISALRTTVKLGELSCHASADDNFNFARVSTRSIDKNVSPVGPLSGEVLQVLDIARARFSLSGEQELRAKILEGRTLALGGDVQAAQSLLETLGDVSESAENNSLDVNIERVAALQAIGSTDEADKLLRGLLEIYAYDQVALQRLDALLEEPVSEANRIMVATVNREGIDLYNRELYDESIECFAKVSTIFPKHVGVHLNIAQAYIGKMRLSPDDKTTKALTQQSLEEIDQLVEPGHPQYQRFERLKQMAETVSLNN